MDRLLREGNPPAGQLASPKPQYKDVQTNNWEELKGEGGASYVKDKDVFAKLEQARALLDAISGKDFATQTTLAAVLAKLADLESELATIKANQLSGDQKVQLSGASGNIISPATEDKLEQVRQLLSGVATENKLEQARTLLDAISTKDFATQTTLAAVLAKLEQLETEIQAVKANQVSGDQKVTLSGTIVEYETAVNAESLPPGGSRIINWNITDEDLIFVAVNIDKAPWSLTGRSMFYTQSEIYTTTFFPERKQVQTTFTSTAAPALSMFLGYVLHDGINSWGEAMEFPKIYKGAGSRNDFRVQNYSDEVATITVRIVRVWNV